MKPHNSDEILIRPVCDEPKEEIKQIIALSNDTLSRRISDQSVDTEKSVINKIIESKLFGLQLNE